MKRRKHGVLYIAFGENYIKEALISAESVKIHNGNLHITLMCDKIIKSPFIDSCSIIDVNHVRAKVDHISKTPYEQTIFLDSDTVINHDISEMFEILSKYDFAIAHDYARKRENIAQIIPEYNNIPYIFSEVNPGVIVFKKNRAVNNFFSLWEKYFYKYHHIMPWEQPTFRVALWKANMKCYIFPPEYNIRSKACRQKQVTNHNLYGIGHLKPRIYHMHANEEIAQGLFNITSLGECLDICKKNATNY